MRASGREALLSAYYSTTFVGLLVRLYRPLLTPLRVTVISIDLEVSTRPVSPASCPKREKVDLVWTMSKKNPMFYLYFIVGLDYRVTRSHY